MPVRTDRSALLTAWVMLFVLTCIAVVLSLSLRPLNDRGDALAPNSGAQGRTPAGVVEPAEPLDWHPPIIKVPDAAIKVPDHAYVAPNAPPEPLVRPSSSADYTIVSIAYATTRARGSNEAPATFYGPTRAHDGRIEYGTCGVSIPRVHKPGLLEAPPKWLPAFARHYLWDPAKHVMLADVVPDSTKDLWLQRLRGLAGTEKDVVVFVHGFCNTFDDAARRLGQVVYDLNFRGVPVLFSWPAIGGSPLTTYQADQVAAEQAVPALVQVLLSLRSTLPNARIHIIAHSMGSRVVSWALKDIAGTTEQPHFGHCVFAAPDIDAGTFCEQYLHPMERVTQTRTLYASSNDAALQASQTLAHGRSAAW